ncbi:uncharacterized protein PG986_004780 [Apiospora aurea]|uniref:Uncharacterized protein n=1 Tax=Apiospora aurea TaxID=335848 RepID=A0ABR1QNJ7_9PEZI
MGKDKDSKKHHHTSKKRGGGGDEDLPPIYEALDNPTGYGTYGGQGAYSTNMRERNELPPRHARNLVGNKTEFDRSRKGAYDSAGYLEPNPDGPHYSSYYSGFDKYASDKKKSSSSSHHHSSSRHESSSKSSKDKDTGKSKDKGKSGSSSNCKDKRHSNKDRYDDDSSDSDDAGGYQYRTGGYGGSYSSGYGGSGYYSTSGYAY